MAHTDQAQQFATAAATRPSPATQPSKGSFKNHVDIILLFFDHPPTSVDIFYVLNLDKNCKF